jgi:hypothetical protein
MVAYFFPHAELSLRLAVEYAVGCGVAGDVAEFGCYLGLTASMLAAAMKEAGESYDYSDLAHGIPQRRLWVFDSFEGFPEATEAPDLAAPHIQAGVWRAGSPAGGSPQEVHAKCAQFIGTDRVHVIPGWYKDTLPTLSDALRFAVIHIDCDYYESTKQVLDHLFSHGSLADGATILFDDWYCNRGSPDYGEQRAWKEAVEEYHIRHSDWGSYGVAGRRFIVHAHRRDGSE